MLNAALLRIHKNLCHKLLSQRKTSKQRFKCEHCEYGMPNQFLLNSHKKICSKNRDNLQKCNICDQEFNSTQLLFNITGSVESLFVYRVTTHLLVSGL